MLLSGLARHDGLNFLLTNRIPRRLASQWVGRISHSENRLIRGLSLWVWRRFTELDLSDAAETRFRSMHDCFTRRLQPGARPIDPSQDVRPDEARSLLAKLSVAQEALLASQIGHDAEVQDLRASNEELQSINEEYRSTAEELEISKEELQSINEELHTINAELKSKLASISVAHNDLQNLTSSTEIGTLFLNPQLRIRTLTQPVAELFNITRVDIGRVITDFANRLDYSNFENDVQQVLDFLAPIEREVQSRTGQSFIVRLRP